MTLKPHRLFLILTACICGLCAWPIFVFSMKHYLPAIDNDEVIYFLEIKTFAMHGFRGGNFFINDQVPLSPIRSGLHGPVFPAIYGLLARLIGWHNQSPYIANVLIFLPSWLLLSVAVGDTDGARIAVALFVLLHGHFFLFLPSMMQESFHLSVAILMAASWTIAIDRHSRVAWTGLFLLTALATLTRYTWALVVPVFVFSFLRQQLTSRSTTPARYLMLVAISLVTGAVVAYLGMKLWLFWTVPPGIESAQGLPSMSLANTLKNLAALFSFDVIQVFDAYPIYFRVSTCILLGWFALAVIFARSAVTREAAAYSLFLLSAPMATQAMYYIVDGYLDFRVLLGFHALAGLTFLSRAELPTVDARRWIKMTVAAAVATAMAINFQLTFKGARSRYDFETQRAEGRETDRTARFWFATMANSMQFVPEETSFCKTVYGSLNVSGDPRIIHMPYGFAFSAVLPVTPDKLPPLKGKYALLHYTPSPLKELFDVSSDWRMLGQFDRFVLYRSAVNCLSDARIPQSR